MKFHPESVIGITPRVCEGMCSEMVSFEQMTEHLDRLDAYLQRALRSPSPSSFCIGDISPSTSTEKLDLLCKPFTELLAACHDASILNPRESERLYQRYGRSLRLCLAQAIPPRPNRTMNGFKSDALASAATQFSALEAYCMSLLPVIPLKAAHSWPSILDMMNETAKEHIVDGNQIEISLSILQEVERANSFNSIPKNANFITRCRDILIPTLKDILLTPYALDQPSTAVMSASNGGFRGRDGEIAAPSTLLSSPVAPQSTCGENKESSKGAAEGMYGKDIPTDGKCFVLTTKMTWKMPQNEGLRNYMIAFIEENLSLSMSNLARSFFDKCVADGKTLYGLQRKKDGRRPKVTNNDWMDKWFVPVHRNEALDVLKSPFRKLLKMTFGMGAADAQGSDSQGCGENIMPSGLEWPHDGFQDPKLNCDSGLGGIFTSDTFFDIVPDVSPINDDIFDDLSISRGIGCSNTPSASGKKSLEKELVHLKKKLENLLENRSTKVDVHFVKLYVTGHKASSLDASASALLYLNYGKTLRKCLAQVIQLSNAEAVCDHQDPLELAASQFHLLDSYVLGLVKCMPLDVLKSASSWPSVIKLIEETTKEFIVRDNEMELVKSMGKHMGASRSQGLNLRYSNFIDRCYDFIPDLEGKIMLYQAEGHVIYDEDHSNALSDSVTPKQGPSYGYIYGRDIPADDTCYAFVPRQTFTLKQNRGLKKYALKVIGENAHRPIGELAFAFFDKCIEDGKTLFCVDSNEKGNGVQITGETYPEQWMNHRFVKTRRSEAPELLRGPFRKILKHCYGIEVEEVPTSSQDERSALVGTSTNDHPVNISHGGVDGFAASRNPTSCGPPPSSSILAPRTATEEAEELQRAINASSFVAPRSASMEEEELQKAINASLEESRYHLEEKETGQPRTTQNLSWTTAQSSNLLGFAGGARSSPVADFNDHQTTISYSSAQTYIASTNVSPEDPSGKNQAIVFERVPCKASGKEVTQVSYKSNEMIDRVADKLRRVQMIDT